MTMDENQREFKVGDRVRYVGSYTCTDEREERLGYRMGMETVIFAVGDMLRVNDADGEERPFYKWEWQHASCVPSQAPQDTSCILPSTEALDRFEALLGRLEAILGGIGKGEVK